MAEAEMSDNTYSSPPSSRTRSGGRARSSSGRPESDCKPSASEQTGNGTGEGVISVEESDEQLQSERIRKELEEKERRATMEKMRSEVEASKIKFEEARCRMSETLKRREKEKKLERIREVANKTMVQERMKFLEDASQQLERLRNRIEEERKKMIENKMDAEEAKNTSQEKMKSMEGEMLKTVKEKLRSIEYTCRNIIEEECEKIELEYASAQEREQAEVRRLQEIQAKTQQEEHKSEHELQKCIMSAESQQRMWDQENEARTAKAREEIDAIEKLKKEIEEREKRLEALANEQLVSDYELRAAKDAESAAREDADQKRAARRQATRDVDLHPCNQATSFSRACTICTNTNPRERVTLVECGHVVCTICAEEMAEKQGQSDKETVDCPFCRKRTKCVKIYEDCEAPVVRKRANDGQDETSPVKKAKEYP